MPRPAEPQKVGAQECITVALLGICAIGTLAGSGVGLQLWRHTLPSGDGLGKEWAESFCGITGNVTEEKILVNTKSTNEVDIKTYNYRLLVSVIVVSSASQKHVGDNLVAFTDLEGLHWMNVLDLTAWRGTFSDRYNPIHRSGGTTQCLVNPFEQGDCVSAQCVGRVVLGSEGDLHENPDNSDPLLIWKLVVALVSIAGAFCVCAIIAFFALYGKGLCEYLRTCCCPAQSTSVRGATATAVPKQNPHNASFDIAIQPEVAELVELVPKGVDQGVNEGQEARGGGEGVPEGDQEGGSGGDEGERGGRKENGGSGETDKNAGGRREGQEQEGIS